MWLDAHDVLERDTQREIDRMYPINYNDPDADGDMIEDEEKYIRCHICGDEVEVASLRYRLCKCDDCLKYRQYSYRDEKMESRQRMRTLHEMHQAGTTYQEIAEMGYFRTAGNAKSAIDKYVETQEKRVRMRERIRNKRVANGLDPEIPVLGVG